MSTCEDPNNILFLLNDARVCMGAPTSCAHRARPIALAHSKQNTQVTHSVTQHDKQEASNELMYIYIQKMCVNSDLASLALQMSSFLVEVSQEMFSNCPVGDFPEKGYIYCECRCQVS